MNCKNIKNYACTFLIVRFLEGGSIAFYLTPYDTGLFFTFVKTLNEKVC